MPTISQKKQEDSWQAEDDARTLANANDILADPKRKSKALKKAKELAKKVEQQANSYKKLFPANGKK
jgi:hypothetical protein